MNHIEEREIAQGLQQGQIDAWNALYDAYAKPIWESVARWMGPGARDVADVVQETFLAAARSAKGYDAARGSLWLWLAGIARNHVAIHYRELEQQAQRVKLAAERLGSGGREVLHWLDGREPTPPEALASAELALLVRAALTELPADYEALLTSKYLDEESVNQIAQAQQCSSAAVRSKLARARRAFCDVFARVAPSRDGRVRGTP